MSIMMCGFQSASVESWSWWRKRDLATCGKEKRGITTNNQKDKHLISQSPHPNPGKWKREEKTNKCILGNHLRECKSKMAFQKEILTVAFSPDSSNQKCQPQTFLRGIHQALAWLVHGKLRSRKRWFRKKQSSDCQMGCAASWGFRIGILVRFYIPRYLREGGISFETEQRKKREEEEGGRRGRWDLSWQAGMRVWRDFAIFTSRALLLWRRRSAASAQREKSEMCGGRAYF